MKHHFVHKAPRRGGIFIDRQRARSGGTARRRNAWSLIRQNPGVYMLLLPGLVYLIVFKYVPMAGLTMAFQDFSIFRGMAGSPWVGLKNFQRLFASQEFYTLFRNSVVISVYKLVLLFPIPILLALMLNEIRNLMFKKTIQTVIYLPHFLSWVIISGLFANILSPSTGIVNQVIRFFGGESISFMMDKTVFRGVLVFTQGWKESGWSAIIYIAAIAGIDPELYEAATVDGAGRFRQMLSITLPSIVPTIVLMLIIKLGYIMDAGFEQVLMMYNPTVYDVADILQTYVYRVGLGKMEYSFSTAVGMFNSVIGFALVISGNFLSRRLVGKSIW